MSNVPTNAPTATMMAKDEIASRRTDKYSKEQWAEMDALTKVRSSHFTAIIRLFSAAEMGEFGSGGAPTGQDISPLIQRVDDAWNKLNIGGQSLPITSAAWKYSPNNLQECELAAKKVGQELGATILGVSESAEKLGVQGILNAKNATRIVYDTPTDKSSIKRRIEGLRQELQNKKFYGPYALLYSNDFDQYLEDDFNHETNPEITVKDDLYESIDGLGPIQRADQFPKQTLSLIQLTPDVIRLIVGIDPVVIEWPNQETDMMTLAIIVPQIRSDFYQNCGIAIGTVKA